MHNKDLSLSPQQVNMDQLVIELNKQHNNLYSQLESLSWLQRNLKLQQLPPLRGWAASPDVLLKLHEFVRRTKPNLIVEFGSGASTIVLADALQQNGHGKLVSIEHNEIFGIKTQQYLTTEGLEALVDLRIGALEHWTGQHLGPYNETDQAMWYPQHLLMDIQHVDLIWVDGPPAATCSYSRYPALPAMSDKITAQTQVWMDDTIRDEEKVICQSWAEQYKFKAEFIPLEKGLGVLTRLE